MIYPEDREDYPLVVDNALPQETNQAVFEEMMLGMTWNNSPKPGGPTFWTQLHGVPTVYYSAWAEFSLRLRKRIQCPLTLFRVYTNGQTFGQNSQFHTDADEDTFWSGVIFTTPAWTAEWGGEFVLFNPHTQRYSYVPYIPGSAVVFPGYWEHQGTAPSKQEAYIRTSLAFTFRDSRLTSPTVFNAF